MIDKWVNAVHSGQNIEQADIDQFHKILTDEYGYVDFYNAEWPGCLWSVQNGYALATEPGLEKITRRINAMSPEEYDALRQQLCIGLQWRTQVTLDGCEHLVSQAYRSALPVGYSQFPPHLWKAFALLVLEASYEATLCAAVLNRARSGNNRVYLTLVGGGVFGNDIDWIIAAIGRAVGMFANAGLDVAIVSYGVPNERLVSLLEGT